MYNELTTIINKWTFFYFSVFPKGENLHWEGLEMAEYKRNVKN